MQVLFSNTFPVRYGCLSGRIDFHAHNVENLGYGAPHWRQHWDFLSPRVTDHTSICYSLGRSSLWSWDTLAGNETGLCCRGLGGRMKIGCSTAPRSELDRRQRGSLRPHNTTRRTHRNTISRSRRYQCMENRLANAWPWHQDWPRRVPRSSPKVLLYSSQNSLQDSLLPQRAPPSNNDMRG